MRLQNVLLPLYAFISDTLAQGGARPGRVDNCNGKMSPYLAHAFTINKGQHLGH
jgi:hypothetical protein